MCEILKWILIIEYLPELILEIIIFGGIAVSGICGLISWIKDEFF